MVVLPVLLWNKADVNSDGFLSDEELLESESVGMTFKVFAESENIMSGEVLSRDEYKKAAQRVCQ